MAMHKINVGLLAVGLVAAAMSFPTALGLIVGAPAVQSAREHRGLCTVVGGQQGGSPMLSPRSLRSRKEQDLNEEEKRMKLTIATYPNDVDALVEYACFLASVKRDFKLSAEMYARAILADTTRARRVAVQLWSDAYAMQVEREEAFKIKERWLDLLASLPGYSGGRAPKQDVLDAVLRLGVQDDPRVRSLVERWADDEELVDVFEFSEALRIEPHETRYRAIAVAERFFGKAPIGDAAGDVMETGLKGLAWRLLLGRKMMWRKQLSLQ